MGEPVFIDFEISNTGERPVWIDGALGEPCIEADPIEVVGAKYHGFGSDTSLGCFAGVAGDCRSSNIELKPGAKRTERILLNGLFRLDHARVYQVRARRHVPVNSQAENKVSPFTQPQNAMDFSSDFPVSLVEGTEEELRQAFQPFVNDIKNSDSLVQSQAISAITEMVPSFLEAVILDLADTPNRASAAAPALGRLNTQRAKRKLAEMAERSMEGPSAIRALAGTHDLAYLPVLIRIASGARVGDRDFAIWCAGLLGRDDAVPFLASVLRNPDANLRIAALRGLGITASRSAVSILIGALQDPDEQVFRQATQSLAQLTHLSITTAPWAETPSAEAYRRWHDWWSRNKLTVPIYGTDSCVQPQPLDAVR